MINILFLTCIFLGVESSLQAWPCTLLVTGCGRSGTTYISSVLQQSGYLVDHECFGEDGCVSWPMAAGSYAVHDSRSTDTFQHVFHQVRHPLAVITSWMVNIHSLDRREWIFIRRHIPQIHKRDSLIVQCAKYWYYWNLLAERKSEWRYRIEDFRKILPEFTERSGMNLDWIVVERIPLNINSWKNTSPTITWAQLKREISKDLYDKIRHMAFRYGYTDGIT